MDSKEVIEFLNNLTKSELEDFNENLSREKGLAVLPSIACAYGIPYDDEEQDDFDVILVETTNRMLTIKAIRNATDLTLVEAKDLVDGVPRLVKGGLAKNDADSLAELLWDAGGKVEIK